MAGEIRCRFDFDRQVAMRLAEQLGSSPAETRTRFERIVDSTTSPPLPVLALLGEVVVHAEDIRRPSGITRDHPVDVLTRVARYYAGSDQGRSRPAAGARAAPPGDRRPRSPPAPARS